jgi:hypothetical protein
MASLAFNHMLGTLSAIYRIYLKVTVVSTYATVFSILFLSKLPCPETTFFPRRNRDPKRRYHMNVVIAENLGIIRSN